MPLTLIQLISEQTMQNLLPVLRLRPSRVVHLATPKTAARSAHIVEAARQAQVEVEPEHIRLSAMPSIAETSRAVTRAIAAARERRETPVVNFTGGTKLMSIGGYEAALREKVASLYVDTDDEEFVDGDTGPGLGGLLEGDRSFTPLHRALTVNAIAVANGRERVTGGRDWKPFLPLARHLVDNPSEEQAVHDALLGRSGLLPPHRAPRSPEEWLEIIPRPFALPPDVARIAAAAGLIRLDAGGSCHLPDGTAPELTALIDARRRGQFVPDYDRRRIAATDAVQFPINLLTGAWWEVIVADSAERSGLFRDLRWSASAGDRAGADLEEDLLAVDGVQAVCVSCKRGGSGARLLPHLEEFNARARGLGGNFTRRFLAVYLPLHQRGARAVRERARILGIRLLGPADLARPGDAFARARAPA